MNTKYIAFTLALITTLTTTTIMNSDKANATTNGWSKENGNWYYYINDESKTGWLNDGGYWYYLNPSSGSMQTGWIKDAEKWYYMDDSGIMQTGKINDNGTEYILGTDGAMNEDVQPPNITNRVMGTYQTNTDDQKPTWELRWKKPTDIKTSQSNLKYYVYQSVGSCGKTMEEWESNATLLNEGGTNDIDRYPLKFEVKEDYLYMVIVENEAGLKASYGIELFPKEYIKLYK
ncbi:Cell wall binding repeat protein [human gut metagenome]|jgi:hypothetical protein|uniref:Cell wall binding repeat protein n=1 Tax=human gut metagenome TaxID=408170 RepID=W1WKB5_9ZZZZ